MDKLLTLVLAGGEGKRLLPLTRNRSKSAVPFGGKYRIIDFALSNCINSGLRQIYVLTQYKSGSLAKHIQEGWAISSAGLGEYIYCVPAQQKMGQNWYLGTADAIRQNLDLVTGKDIDTVLVLSGDHIYKMDYRKIVEFHHKQKANFTISAVRVNKAHAANTLGVIEADKSWRVLGFEEKPGNPKTIPGSPGQSLVSMGVYVFKAKTIIEIMKSEYEDFGKNVIPNMVARGKQIYVYDYETANSIKDYIVEVQDGTRKKIMVERTRDSSYWRDVGTIDSYYEASTDLIGVDPIFNLYGEKWPLRTFQREMPPTKFVLGGSAEESILSDGCIISGGHVYRSILSPGVIVERDALVVESIIFDDVNIESGVKIKRAIIDKDVQISAGVVLGYNLQSDIKRGCMVSPSGIVVVPKGLVLRPN